MMTILQLQRSDETLALRQKINL